MFYIYIFYNWYANKLDMDTQAAPSSITVGSQVWVEDPDDAWLDGEVIEIKGEEIKVKCKDKTVSACSQDFVICPPSPFYWYSLRTKNINDFGWFLF